MSVALDALPHAPIGMVLGLLEHLQDAPNGREDVYKLGGPLGYELDDLLPVTSAAKRLGLVHVAAGDIELTEEGRALAAAEEPERKRRVGRCVLALALVAEIRRAIEASDNGRASKKEFLDRLEPLFSSPEAERQISTALDWARYGEVFDFDPDTEEFFLARPE